ncbi:MAG: hypothetical protein M4579_002107 [Chaenotheca gracillima]|nr:MAG: hypothetical protein M4579_002107 [Chaenotheca gracillima]
MESPTPKLTSLTSPPRILIIGAGSRGNAYARAIRDSTNGRVVAVADPIAFKRRDLIRRHVSTPGHISRNINGDAESVQEYSDWREFVEEEKARRAESGADARPGVDGVFVCVLDEMHAEIITTLAMFEGLHVMCEKPLATRLGDCLDIYKALRPEGKGERGAKALFSIGHVLRYSPHNMMLRKLLLEEEVVGEVISVEHTEPVGWWHFSHSYVRGNWRKEAATAPSLLTKSCHDIDVLLWLLCSPPPNSKRPPHLPSKVASTGNLVYFKKSRKPPLAGNATNCLSCAAEPVCQYSAKKIYGRQLQNQDTGWPIKIVAPEIEDVLKDHGMKAAENLLVNRLAEDYDDRATQEQIDARPWFGRCVYESSNDVCDDQIVTMTWSDDPLTDGLPDGVSGETQSLRDPGLKGRGAKTAVMHMVAFTEQVCQRRSRIYGTTGEIEADSVTIKVHNFATGHTQTYHPPAAGGGHGGGDDGLAQQFILAVDAVKNHGATVEDAQREYIGCTVEEAVRSHAMVFAAEEARKSQTVVDWADWWEQAVESELREKVTQTMYSIPHDMHGTAPFE